MFVAAGRPNAPSFNNCYIHILQRTELVGLNKDDNEENIKNVKGNTIYFQFMPKMILDSESAVYDDVPVTGRSVPITSYSFSTPRTISFDLSFYVKPEQNDVGPTPKDIKDTINRLRSLVKPEYEKFFTYPPSRCLVRIGDQIAMIGVLHSIQTRYPDTIPWTIRTVSGHTLAMYVMTHLVFREVAVIPLSASDVANGRYITTVPELPTGNDNTESNVRFAPPIEETRQRQLTGSGENV